MFAVILLLTLLGFALYVCVGLLKKVLIPWHESVVDTVRTTV
jgi:ABC-type nitrate/sulfonate/bicarbonate transport system permease component